MLAAVAQWMKSLDPQRYSRWLLLLSSIVVVLTLPWVLGDFFGFGFRAPLLTQLAGFGAIRCIQLHSY
jgi:hypothetical protein